MEIDLLMLVDYACLLGGVSRDRGGRSCQALPNPCKHGSASLAMTGSARCADLVLLRRTTPVARAVSLLFRRCIPALSSYASVGRSHAAKAATRWIASRETKEANPLLKWRL